MKAGQAWQPRHGSAHRRAGVWAAGAVAAALALGVVSMHQFGAFDLVPAAPSLPGMPVVTSTLPFEHIAEAKKIEAPLPSEPTQPVQTPPTATAAPAPRNTSAAVVTKAIDATARPDIKPSDAAAPNAPAPEGKTSSVAGTADRAGAPSAFPVPRGPLPLQTDLIAPAVPGKGAAARPAHIVDAPLFAGNTPPTRNIGAANPNG
ncbi:MAG TPA: hypothetical protein VHY35_25185 [Stellaceae bacterium]|jgi:predicted lipid-binding transport protein (Tim44 family)|nr:hypothetical protein [Stellaceae bacterium]